MTAPKGPKNPNLRYRTGERVYREPEPEAVDYSPSKARDAAWADIEARDEKRWNARLDGAHRDAISMFDTNFPELIHNPATAQRVVAERYARMDEAARKGVPFDEGRALMEIGEGIRKEMGLPGLHDKLRKEWLDEERRSRTEGFE